MLRITLKRRVALVGVCLAVTLACAPSTSPCADAADPRQCLWVPAEASILRPAAVYRKGNAEVAFTIPLEEFRDQEAFAARLSQHVEGLGWRRRRWRYLNPTPALTFDWERSGGGVRITGNDPKRTIESRKWRGEWEDAEGNVLEYSLSAFRVAEGAGHYIRAFAAYIPADLVKAGVNADFR